MGNKLAWGIFAALSCGILFLFLTLPATDNGGDMVEYFGMTESLLNHGGIHLTDYDFDELKRYLSPGYFAFQNQYEETKGGFMAYVPGTGGYTYSLHFWFYSLIAAPVRIVLRIFNLNELHTLRLANWVLFTLIIGYVMQRFLPSPRKKLLFLASVAISPLMFFLIYPGVDAYYSLLLLAAVFALIHRKYAPAALFSTLASWHSQPLALVTVFIIGLYLYDGIRRRNLRAGDYVTIVLCIALGSIPYLSNLRFFGVLSPWSTIRDGWTQIYGFGLRNLSLKRLAEQFFDLNMGLFWYAPVTMIAGFVAMVRSGKKHPLNYAVIALMILVAFGYQTNPAWHYGTAGFAPTRHVLFAVPFLIAYAVEFGKINRRWLIALALPLAFQFYALANNGYLNPYFYNSMFHSPYASLVLKYAPGLYNPTPKIFVDRTTHTDKKFITTAIYKDNGVCRKAYVTRSDRDLLLQECGYIPGSPPDALEDDMMHTASYPRNVYVIDGVLIPDPAACQAGFTATEELPYACMRTPADFVMQTGFDSALFGTRVQPAQEQEGGWIISKGDVVRITVPPGYRLWHQSLEGTYVNY